MADVIPISGTSAIHELSNLEAEQTLLGACLNNSAIAADLPCKASDFSVPLHERIFTAIHTAALQGRQTGALLLRPQFENDPDIADVGGVVYLARILNFDHGLIPPKDIATQIADLANRRRLLELINQAQAQLLDTREEAPTAAEIVARAFPEDETNRGGRYLDATEFVWRSEEDLPRREWIYGHHLIRKFLSVDVAAGGIGKSSLKVVEAIALTTGRQLVGKEVHGGPYRVWLYNLEDPHEEIERRIHAAAKHYRIEPQEIGNRLYVNSGRDQPLVIAEETDAGSRIIRPISEALISQIKARRIDVLIIDPFVSSHALSENDNRAIDMVAKEWSRIADVCDCSINLIHHIRKQNGGEVTAESSRGAVSLIGAARSVIVYNRMTKEEAESAGIPADQCGFYFRTQADKANLAPPEKADWHRMNNVDLSNGDQVGVACPWHWPDAFEGVAAYHLAQVQAKIADAEWREDIRSANWAGNVVAEVLDIDASKPAERNRVRRILNDWVKNGALQVVERPDAKRMMRRFIVVGSMADAH